MQGFLWWGQIYLPYFVFIFIVLQKCFFVLPVYGMWREKIGVPSVLPSFFSLPSLASFGAPWKLTGMGNLRSRGQMQSSKPLYQALGTLSTPPLPRPQHSLSRLRTLTEQFRPAEMGPWTVVVSLPCVGEERGCFYAGTSDWYILRTVSFYVIVATYCFLSTEAFFHPHSCPEVHLTGLQDRTFKVVTLRLWTPSLEGLDTCFS